MITAMFGLTSLAFLVIDGIKNKTIGKSIKLLLAMATGLLIAGIWLYPALSGGIVGMDSSAKVDVMELWMAGFTTLLNPMNRINGITDSFYYGISFTFISLAGIFLSSRKNNAGFIVFLAILVLTNPAFVTFLSKAPMSELFWMTRYETIAYGFFVFSLMEWKKIKKKYAVVVLIILAIDCAPSLLFNRYYTNTTESSKESTEALKENTVYRNALMDESTYGSYPSWELSVGEDKIFSTFGWAWQGASTSSNIVMLNTALDYEAYDYLFDRCVELGNDTVLLKKQFVGKNGHNIDDVMMGAKKSGYYLKEELTDSYLFKKDTPESFGVKSTYRGLAVGKYSNTMTLFFPAFKCADSNYIDDYSFDDLREYETLFLCGMEYHNKENAENLLYKLADSGVKVVVDSTHVKEDESTKQMTFLGVTNQSITIQNHFPILNYNGKTVNPKDFTEEYLEWYTGYIGQVDNPIGTFNYGDKTLTWLGTNNAHKNIYYMGLNVLYHAVETEDNAVFLVLEDILGIKREEIPERKLIPIQLEIGDEEIRIHSSEEDYNSTLAFQDNFSSEQKIYADNNLLNVHEKDAVIKMNYPKKSAGIAISVFGVLCLLGLVWIERKNRE